jgi:hypothetical protein
MKGLMVLFDKVYEKELLLILSTLLGVLESR